MRARHAAFTIPSPTPIFVGRDAELARLASGLERVRVALVYGVGGVGKSALVYAYAKGRGDVVYRRAADEPLATLAGDLRRQIGGAGAAETPDEEEALADLARRLDERGALLVVDDLHRLAPAARAVLVEALAARLANGRFVATSRELLPLAPGGADRLEVHLGGLEEEASHALWRSLDELYGPAPGFERATARARGNPFQLRRAHAGGLDDEDPIAAAVRGLAPVERRVAAALALASFRLPIALLAELVAGEDVRAALRTLVTRLVVDVDATETCGLHALFHDAVLAEVDAETRRELHASLARLLPTASFDIVVQVREVTRHLRAIERFDEAQRHLVENGPALFRSGATREVLEGIEAIPAARRSGEVQLLRARVLGRLFETERAYRELERLVRADVAPVHDCKLGLGEYALAYGDLDVAHRVLGELTADEHLPPPLRATAVSMLALTLTQRGKGDEARAMLRAEEQRAGDEHVAANFAFGQCFTLSAEERDREAEEPMRRARALLPTDKSPRFATGVLVPLTFATILARLGRFDEVRDLLAFAESFAKKQEDFYTSVFFRRHRALVLYEQGERVDAQGELRFVAEVYERGRCPIAAGWARAWIARIDLLLGRRVEAVRALDAIREDAERRGFANVAATVAHGLGLDPLSAVRAEPPPLAAIDKPGELARARAVAALRAAASGQAERARALVADNARAVDRPGYELDRALGHLALETAARLAGDARAAAEEHGRAERVASEGRVDADLLERLLAEIGKLRLVTASAPPAAGASPDLAAFDVVIDGRTHELRGKGLVIRLERMPTLRKMLYALAGSPNQAITKERLAKSLWGGAYHPLRHDNGIWVSLRRLRQLVEPSGLFIDLDDEGYKLRVPERFLYVDPGD